jgi:hypothetical protein
MTQRRGRTARTATPTTTTTAPTPVDPAADTGPAAPTADSTGGAESGAEKRCDKTDLIETQCAHCRHDVDTHDQLLIERAALIGTGHWYPSKYPGICANCGEYFEANAAIRGDPRGWVAECCADCDYVS